MVHCFFLGIYCTRLNEKCVTHVLALESLLNVFQQLAKTFSSYSCLTEEQTLVGLCL